MPSADEVFAELRRTYDRTVEEQVKRQVESMSLQISILTVQINTLAKQLDSSSSSAKAALSHEQVTKLVSDALSRSLEGQPFKLDAVQPAAAPASPPAAPATAAPAPAPSPVLNATTSGQGMASTSRVAGAGEPLPASSAASRPNDKTPSALPAARESAPSGNESLADRAAGLARTSTAEAGSAMAVDAPASSRPIAETGAASASASRNGAPSNQAVSRWDGHIPAPVPTGYKGSWLGAALQWTEGGNGLPRPLKHCVLPLNSSSSACRAYKRRRTIGMEYERLGCSVKAFEEAWPSASSGGMVEVYTRIREEQFYDQFR